MKAAHRSWPSTLQRFGAAHERTEFGRHIHRRFRQRSASSLANRMRMVASLKETTKS